MRFSEYFEKSAEFSKTDRGKAEALVREAEKHSLAAVPEHLILCAEIWMAYLHDRDQALRCLYRCECRSDIRDSRAFFDLAEAYFTLVQDFPSVRRCLQKAVAAMPKEEIPSALKKWREKAQLARSRHYAEIATEKTSTAPRRKNP